MSYLDCFIVPVKRADLAVYRQIAAEMAHLWREMGALSVVEAVADELPWGNATSFPRAVLAEPDEVVVVATMAFHDKAHKEAVTAVAYADARMTGLWERIPVDGARMFFGGFDIFVNERSPDL